MLSIEILKKTVLEEGMVFIMIKKASKTRHDELMQDKEYVNIYQNEYEKLLVSESLVKVRHEAKLNQATLEKRSY